MFCLFIQSSRYDLVFCLFLFEPKIRSQPDWNLNRADLFGSSLLTVWTRVLISPTQFNRFGWWVGGKPDSAWPMHTLVGVVGPNPNWLGLKAWIGFGLIYDLRCELQIEAHRQSEENTILLQYQNSAACLGMFRKTLNLGRVLCYHKKLCNLIFSKLLLYCSLLSIGDSICTIIFVSVVLICCSEWKLRKFYPHLV